jgi:hypothetical protein
MYDKPVQAVMPTIHQVAKNMIDCSQPLKMKDLAGLKIFPLAILSIGGLITLSS